MSAQRHQIQRQIFDITVPDRALGLRLHDELARIQGRAIEALIDRCCTELSAPDRVHRLGRVEVDLGELSLDSLESELTEKLYPVLREALAAKIREDEELTAMIGEDPAQSARLELISLFARTGTLPFWADVARAGAVDEAAAGLLARDRQALARLVRELSTDVRALGRLARHVAPARLRELFEALVQAEAPQAAARSAELWELFAIARTADPPAKAATLWVAALSTACRGESRGQSAVPFFREVLGRASIESGIAYQALVAGLDKALGPRERRKASGFGPVAAALAAEFEADRRPCLAPTLERSEASGASAGTSDAPRASARAPEPDRRGPGPVDALPENKNIHPTRADALPGDKNIRPTLVDTLLEDKNIRPAPADALLDDKNSAQGPSEARPEDKNIPPSPDGTPRGDKNIDPAPVDAPRRDKRIDPALGATSRADQKFDPSPSDGAHEDSRVGPSNSGAVHEEKRLDPSLDHAPQGETRAASGARGAARAPLERPEAPSARPPEPAPLQSPSAPQSSRTDRRADAPREAPRAAPPYEARPQNKPSARAPNEDPDAVYLDTAGLVLLWPFLAAFFDRVGLLTKKKAFLDAAARGRAVLLLQRLATSEPEPAEYRLPLAKVLCGMPLDDVFDPGPEITEAEIRESDDLLAAVLDHAKSFGHLTPRGLRDAFLLRRGALSARGEAWLLRVERAPYDLLLNQLPWPLTWVRLPWMEAPLAVEWIV